MTAKLNPILIGLAVIITIASSLSIITASGQFGGGFSRGFVPTGEEVLPVYVIRIPPGAAQKDNPEHYYPPSVAIPAGTTIGWFNDDPGQPHTVTSGVPGASDAGSLFNSGIIPFGSSFQYTFAPDLSGEYTYYCEIHPWRTAKVSVSAAIDQEFNFELRSGTGPDLSLSKNNRTLLDFRPTTVTTDETTPLTYNVVILDGNTNQTVFSRTFFVLGNDLYLELIAANNNTNTTTTEVYGPDFSDPITGAYHVQGNFIKPNTDYKITVEITAIGSQTPENPIRDTFNFRVLP